MDTVTINLSIFDWSGNLISELREDEATFGIRIKKVKGSECMGFTSFQIAGDADSVYRFLDFYELENES